MKILVVDDDEYIRQIIAEILEDQHHQVVTASLGSEGLEILKKEADFDLVITDRNMPGMLGEEVIKVAKLQCPEIKVFLMTGLMTKKVELAAKAAGADAIFDKKNYIRGNMAFIKSSFDNKSSFFC